MFEHMTPEYIKRIALEKAKNKEALSYMEGGFLDDALSGVSYVISNCYGNIDRAMNTLLLETSDGEYIVKRCAEEGVFRKIGEVSTGTLIFTGEAGYEIPIGTGAYLGELRYETAERVIISEDGGAVALARADDVGEAYNASGGAVASLEQNLAGVTSVSLGDFEGGVDEESLESLKLRYFEKKQNPPLSGNAAHYEQWAMEVPGVARAKAIPAWNGGGTVKVILTGEENSVVGEEIIDNVFSHITENAPPADVTVVSVAEKEIAVSISLVFSDAELEALKEKIREDIELYFSEFSKSTMYASSIVAIIRKIENVEDCTVILDGGSSVQIPLGNVPKVGAYTVTEG